MEQPQDTGVVRIASDSQFDNKKIIAVEVDGRPMWSSKHVGAALGYTARGLTTVIGQKWSDELVEGVDFIIVTNGKLKSIRKVAPSVCGVRAPSLMMLTESGVHLVALLSRKPAAKRLRRWLADEVLPAIRRTGGYESDGGGASRPNPDTGSGALTASAVIPEFRQRNEAVELESKMRAVTMRAVMSASGEDLLALMRMLVDDSTQGGRYWRPSGVSVAAIRRGICADLKLLDDRRLHMLTRWITSLLGTPYA